jgi:hypothetical protein
VRTIDNCCYAQADGTSVARVIGLSLTCKSAFLVQKAPAVSYMIAESLGVSTQVMVTGLILLRLTRTWLTISASCPSLRRMPMYSNVAALVIESAAPVTLLGAVYITVVAISYHHHPEILIQRGTLNALSEVSYSLYFSFYVSPARMHEAMYRSLT